MNVTENNICTGAEIIKRESALCGEKKIDYCLWRIDALADGVFFTIKENECASEWLPISVEEALLVFDALVSSHVEADQLFYICCDIKNNASFFSQN